MELIIRDVGGESHYHNTILLHDFSHVRTYGSVILDWYYHVKCIG